MVSFVVHGFVVATLLAFMSPRTSALSVTVHQLECVSENVLFSGDMVYGNFMVMRHELVWGHRHPGIEFTALSPDGETVYSLKRSTGDKFEFKAPKRGTYKFCFRNLMPSPETVSFYIGTGHIPDAADKLTDGKSSSSENDNIPDPHHSLETESDCFTDSTNTTLVFLSSTDHHADHFDPVNVKIAELRQALEFVTAEQKYLKARETSHRYTNESTRTRLLFYTVTEYALLAIASGFQVLYIKRLFGKSIAYNVVG